MFNNIFKTPRAKKNAISVSIIALVIACIIMFNAIVTVLGDKFDWYIDMTDEQIYTISDALKETLNGANMNVGVEVIFTCSEDYAKSNFSNLSSGEALAYVHSTATQIAKEYPNVTISYHDNEKEPEFFKTKFTEIERFLSSMENPIIIARQTVDEKTGEITYGTHFKVYAARSFYGFSSKDSSLYAYNGEKVFASAILSLTLDETPAVYFLTGHNEKIYTKNGENTMPLELVNLFYYCGFKVEELDLDNNDLPKDARMVIVNEPEFDLSARIIAKLDSYMADQGSVMVFTNPDFNDKTPRLLEFIESRCGVTTNSGGKVTDDKSNIIGDKFSFRGEISSNNAAKVYLLYLSNATGAKPFFTNSTSVTIDSKYSSESGSYEGDYTYTLPLFQTSNSGKYKDVNGNHIVMTVTSVLKNRDNGEKYSYLVYCPSSGFASDSALQNQAYPNSDIVLSLVHAMTSAQTTVEIDYKAFANYDLDITESQAKTATVLISIVLPIIAIAVGTVIIFRRKRR